MASDFNTLKSVRDNVITVLKGKGINFTAETYDDITTMPGSILPHGELRVDGVDFENTHGQRSSYAEVRFFVRIVFKSNDAKIRQDDQLKWIDLIRKGLTVSALNINDLATSKLVSLVTTEAIDIDNSDSSGLWLLNYEVLVRYREA